MAAGRNQWLTSSPSVQLLIRHRAGDELYNLPEIHIDLESSKFWWNMIENNLLTLPTPYSAESMLVGLLVPHLGFPGSLESGQHASPTIQRSNTLRLWGSGWKETFLTSVHRDASLVGAAFQPRIKASMIVLNVSSIQLQYIIRNTSLSIYDMLQLICVRLYILIMYI